VEERPTPTGVEPKVYDDDDDDDDTDYTARSATVCYPRFFPIFS